MASYTIKPRVPKINWNNRLTKGLVFACPLSEGGGSTSINLVSGLNGTHTNTSWSNQSMGKSVSFSSGGKISFAHSSSLDITGPFTMSTWIYTPGGNTFLDKDGQTSAGFGFRLVTSYFALTNALLVMINNTTYDSNTLFYTTNTWFNAVVTYDGTTITYYNNSSVNRSRGGANPTTNTNPLLIGNRTAGGQNFDGYIADMRLYNRALNKSEVKELYKNPWGIYKKSYSYFFSRASSSFSATGGTITQSGGYKIHTFTSNGTFTVTGSGTVDALVIGGGGGGAAGGGGGGGYQYQSSFAVTEQAYSITVGAGGTKGDGYAGSVVPTAGSNSVFSTITATGGGKGGTNFADVITNGGNGGSGGGGAYSGAGATTGGTGSQGNNGGTNGSQGAPFPAGGGGGAGAVGQNAPDTTHGGAGGAGTANSISGTSVTYAGGGGGGVYGAGTGGAGGAGGGGAGGTSAGNGTNGTANTGGGGGGTGNGGGLQGGDGGSGIVIIRYLNPLVSGRASMQSRANFLNLQRL